MEPEPEPEPVVEEVVVEVEEPEEIEEPTAVEPVTFYDYPFVERLEDEIIEEFVPEEEPVAETVYTWTEEQPTESLESALAYIVPEGGVLKERATSRRA